MLQTHNCWSAREYAPQTCLGGSAEDLFHRAGLLKWSNGLSQGKILSAEMLRQMTTAPGEERLKEQSYGYGFELAGTGATSSYGHGGMAPGVNSEFRYFVSPDVTLVLLCDQDNAAFDDLKLHDISLIERAAK